MCTRRTLGLLATARSARRGLNGPRFGRVIPDLCSIHARPGPRTGAPAMTDPLAWRGIDPKVRTMHLWQETERVHRPGRVPQPGNDPAPVHRQLGPQRRGVRSERPSVRPAVRHDHPRRDRHRIPTPRTSHGRREPALAIQGGHELADVDDLGLQLDDQQDPACRVPREDVDDAAFAVDREGDFRSAIQPGRSPKNRAISSCIRAWRALTRRPRSPPCHRTTESSRASRAPATARILPSGTPPRRPCSILRTTQRETPARIARSSWRQPFRVRIKRRDQPMP